MKRLVLIVLLIALALLLCPLAFAAPFRPECGVKAYENLLMQYAMRYPGTAIWPLQDPPSATSIKELTGVYPGTPSATGVTLQSTGPIVSGETAKAAAFDVTGFITLPYIPIVSPTGAWTISLWFNGAPQNNKRLFSIMNLASSRGLIVRSDYTSPYSKITVTIVNAEGASLLDYKLSTQTYMTSSWNLLTITASNGVVAVYKNGVADGTNFNFTPAGTFNNTIFYVPQGGVISASFILAVPAALSATEVLSIYNAATKGL